MIGRLKKLPTFVLFGKFMFVFLGIFQNLIVGGHVILILWLFSPAQRWII